MTAEKLNEVFANEAKQAHRCYDCGGKVLLRYAPGCTFIHCFKEGRSVAALPDWQPEELAQEWNEK